MIQYSFFNFKRVNFPFIFYENLFGIISEIDSISWMESRQIISLDQSRQIIQTFFRVNFKFKRLLQVHKSNHKDHQVVEHVKKIFIGMILDIQRELMIANKIKTMQLYQNKSQQMFNHLMNLQEILNQDHVSDFTIYYRNRVSRVTVYQTDLIPSQKRLAIYNAFISYAIDHDLFRFCIQEQEYSQKVEMLQDPMNLYTSQVLEEMYKLYILQNGNIKMVELKMKKQGRYKNDKYEGELLKHNIMNLHLIGLYRMYRSAMRKSTRPCSGWQTFSGKYLATLKKLQFEWLKILFRVAVYDNATISQINELSRVIKRKLVPQPEKLTKKVREQNEKKQRFLNALKGEMRKILNSE